MDAAVVVAPGVVIVGEVQVVRAVVAAVDVQRTRPVVAERPSEAELGIVAETRSRQEDTVAFRAGNTVTVNAIEFSPLPSAFIKEFLLLL